MDSIELLDWFIDLWDRLCDEYKELWLVAKTELEKAELMAKICELRLQKGIAISIKEKMEDARKENNSDGV